MEKISLFLEIVKTYSGRNYIWFLAAAAMIFLAVKGNKDARRIFVWPLLAALLVLNPLTASVISDRFSVSNRFIRFFWVLPFYEVIGYVAVFLADKCRKASGKAAVLAAVAAAVALTGNAVFFGKDVPAYELPQNSQYTEDEYIALKEILHQDGIERPVVLYDGHLMLTYRLYDPSVKSVFTRDDLQNMSVLTEEEFNSLGRQKAIKIIADVYYYHDFTISWNSFEIAAAAKGTDYIITSKNSELNEKFSEAEYEIAGETVQYRVWKFPESTD